MKKIKMSKKNIIISIIIVFLFFISSISFFYFTEVNGFFRESKDVEISVKSGDTLDDIAKQLNQLGVIKNKLIFKIYSKFDANSSKIKAGEFLLKANSNYASVFSILSGASNNLSKKITVIDGENLIDIAKKVSDAGICSEEEFLENINKQYGFEFEEHIKDNELKLFRNEGFVYPDTYFFPNDVKVEEVCKSMLSNFDKKMKSEYYDRMNEIGYSFEQIITLASIIQKEASRPDDMKMVSSVFFNRLNKENGLLKLQSDVTVFYARDVVGQRTNNQEMVNAYSTYLSEGLPIGPICSPSISAIEAALYPSQTDYLYFLTDLNTKFYYAKTYAEHLNNQRIAEEVNNSLN